MSLTDLLIDGLELIPYKKQTYFAVIHECWHSTTDFEHEGLSFRFIYNVWDITGYYKQKISRGNKVETCRTNKPERHYLHHLRLYELADEEYTVGFVQFEGPIFEENSVVFSSCASYDKILKTNVNEEFGTGSHPYSIYIDEYYRKSTGNVPGIYGLLTNTMFDICAHFYRQTDSTDPLCFRAEMLVSEVLLRRFSDYMTDKNTAVIKLQDTCI